MRTPAKPGSVHGDRLPAVGTATETEPQMRIPNAQSLVERFNLIRAGESRGKRRLPPATQQGLDPKEQEVVDYCTQRVAEALEAYQKESRVYAERMIPTEPTGLGGADLEKACAEFDATVEEHREDLKSSHSETQGAIDELADFRREQELKREPKIPDNPWKSWAVLGVVLLIETFANGFFFGQQIGTGLIGGVSQAVLISVINVILIGGLAAFIARHVIHRDQVRRIAAGLGLIVIAVGALIWNLAVAHYREALPGDYPPPPPEVAVAGASDPVQECYRGPNESDSDAEAICLLTARWFRLGGFRSWALMLIGLAACVFAVWEFLRMSDPYPGYSGLERKRREADEVRKALRFQVLSQLKDVFDRAETRQRNGLANPVNAFDRASQAFDDSRDAHRRLRDLVRQLENSCRGAISRYRSVNRDARRPTPDPKSWQKEWTPTDWDLPSAPVPRDLGARADAIARGQQEEKELEARIRKLRANYTSACEEVVRITEVRDE